MFKKIILIGTLFIAGIAQASAEEKYYGHIMFRESPYSAYKGIYPLSKKETTTQAHYVFDYDEQGRVIEISRKIGSKLIADNGTFDSFIWFSPKVKIAYGKATETHTYFNPFDEQVSAHGNVYRAEYSLGEKGKRKSLKFYDKDNITSQNAWNIHLYNWGEDSEGRIIEKRYDLEGEQRSIRPEFKFFEVRMEYDHEGKLTFVRNYGLDGKPTNNDSGAGIDRITYDLNGNFVRWQVYDKDGAPVEGNRPMVHLGEHLYDSKGNKIGLRGFDRSGQQVKFSWGDYFVKNTYDVFGNQTSTAAFNEAGKEQRRLVIGYTNNGLNREWLRAFDPEGHMVESPMLGGVAAIQLSYDQDGRRKGVSRFDANMEEIKPKEVSK